MRKLENLNVSDFLSIIRRRIWYLILTALAVSTGAFAYISQLPSIYRSETTIIFSGRIVPEDYIRSLDRGGTNDRVDFVRQHIHSRSFLTRIVQEFQLAPPGANLEVAANSLVNRVEFVPLTPASFKLAFTATDASLAQTVTRRLAEGVIQLNDSLRRERVQVADQFLEEQAREAASQLATAEQKLWEFRNQKFPGVSPGTVNLDDLRSLRAELGSLDTRLQTALAQKKSFERRLEERQQLKTVVATPAPRNRVPAPILSATPPVLPASPPSAIEERLARARSELIAATGRYTSLHPEVVRLRQEIEELQALVQLTRTKEKEAPPAIANDTTSQQRPEAFPDLNLPVDLLQSEIQGEIAQIAGEVAKLEQGRKTLVARISLMETQLNPPPALSQQLATLNREYESAKQRYNYLTDKKFSSEMATRVDGSANNEIFNVLDEATLPTDPISPNRRLFRTVGLLAGLLMGFGAAFARELLDSSFHTAADAVAELKLPVLGGIPNVQTNLKVRKTLGLPMASASAGSMVESRMFRLAEAESKIRDVIMNPLAPAGEPYRLMHAKLLTMQKQQGMKTILITSALPGEGKTFAATCLAGVLARESGRKVLLIDGDLRTGSASRALGFHDCGIGLNELLDDAGDLATLTNDLAERYPDSQVVPLSSMLGASIFQCAEVSLHFLPSGTTREKPSHLLNTPQLEALINQAELNYDWIIIDSPPVLALADANILAPLCDGTVLVVRTGKTPSILVKDAIQRIGTERVCGLLMNRVRAKETTYYYGAYYGESSAKKLHS